MSISLNISKSILAFLCVVAISGLLRFSGLELFSPPLNRDEAAIGYNAYSLLLTGKDEHGKSWPTAFESIGDYKMPGYIYATMLPIKLFGLSDFSVRFWSALAGTLAVIAIWLLAKQLLVPFVPSVYKQWVPFASALLLAINPWHLHYSRVGFESNLNITLFLFSLLCVIKGLKNAWWLVGASVLLVSMQFVYSSTFLFLPVFVPFLLLAVMLSNEKKWLTQKLPLILAGTLLIGGSFWAVLSVTSVSKAKQSITVFSDPQTIDTYNHLRTSINQTNPLVAKLWYNKPFYMGRIIVTHYVENLSPSFLFFNKVAHPWHSVPGQGYFYWLDGIFLLIGLYWIGSRVLFHRTKTILFTSIILIGWLVASPVASAITIDAPHATRSLYLIPVVVLFSALGGVMAIFWLAKHMLFSPKMIGGLVLSLYGILLIKFIYAYLIQYPYHYPPSLYSGIKPVVEYIEADPSKSVYFTSAADSPYLYVLFYGKVDPSFVQSKAIWFPYDPVGLTNIEYLGNYHFLHMIPDVKEKATWVLQGETEPPPGFFLEKEFKSNKTGKIEWRLFSN